MVDGVADLGGEGEEDEGPEGGAGCHWGGVRFSGHVVGLAGACWMSWVLGMNGVNVLARNANPLTSSCPVAMHQAFEVSLSTSRLPGGAFLAAVGHRKYTLVRSLLTNTVVSLTLQSIAANPSPKRRKYPKVDTINNRHSTSAIPKLVE